MDDPISIGPATHEPRARKRHRVYHRKSRNGCFSCKSRRVKCDEAHPVCGACSSRGEPCSFPSISLTSRTESSQGDTDKFSPSPPLVQTLSPEEARRQRLQLLSPCNNLEMENLKLIHYFHMHTAKQMTMHPRRSQVWQRVIPDIAIQSRYLTHLLLALGGIHMFTHQSKHRQDEESDIVDLQVVMEHHQNGLRGFLGAVGNISATNAEMVYTGSLLLVAFIFASLQIPQLNSLITSETTLFTLGSQCFQVTCGLHFSWLHLIRGVSTVIHDQWPTLKASRLRQLVLYMHSVEYWENLPFSSSLPSLSCYPPRLQKFAHGANEAICNLKAFRSRASTSGATLDEQSKVIDVLESAYSRVVCVMYCSAIGQLDQDGSDLQIDFEEAAVLSWPVLIPRDFIASLENIEEIDTLHGYSLTVLAHFYLIDTLIDCWYLNGSFEGEILKIQALVQTLGDTQLTMLIQWPVEVVRL